ncbi:histone H1-delta-like [Ruditapes philippinarum]|uniref:histone H1-delta-like n=1 Tax=Ruditapes philippinarum TaxID=129788 RepID=UPI00295A7D64|nr:histone H1-delta-like [Ruditapes philippinarum]
MADTAVESPVVAEENDSAKTEEVKSPAKRASKGKAAKTPKTKATPKGKAVSANKKQKKTVSDMHPKYSQMINESIAALKERNGSSRQAILKYIMANYSVLPDEKLVNNHIKMSIRAGIKSGKLKQIKGSGACGSYKLGDKGTEKPSKPKAEKAASPTKKASLTKVKKPKASSKKSKAQSKKAVSGKASPKTSPQKAKASPKKTTKKTKSPKKTKAKKAAKSPRKSKKAAAPEEKQDTEDVPATEAETNESDQ